MFTVYHLGVHPGGGLSQGDLANVGPDVVDSAHQWTVISLDLGKGKYLNVFS